MDTKLFLSTFLLIFLAELGDKTQLTAMAKAAGSDGGKWTVFAAAGAALLLSTLLAVLFGHLIARVVPEHVISMLAGSVFLLFGALLLISALRSTKAPQAPSMTVEVPGSGMMVRAILHIAADFEEAAADDYASLAAETDDARIRTLLLELGAEEQEHLEMMRDTHSEHSRQMLQDLKREHLPAGEALQHDVAQSDQPILAHALEHEQATAAFYRELAERTPIPALQRTFAFLAQAEQEHVRKISTLLSHLSAS